MSVYYKDYASFLGELFDGKVQKLSVDIGLSCPNRDGTLGTGGCIYCRNDAFSPDFEKRALPVEEQLRRGKDFFARKYPQMRYLAYFQSFTSTYGDRDAIKDAYGRALADDGVVGMVVSTRPDCFDRDVAAMLSELKSASGKEVIVEFGVETLHDATLGRINRHHSAECACDAVCLAAAAGFPVGVHLILGLPGETESMMAYTVARVSSLPVSTVKFHQLQVLRGTELERQYLAGALQDMPVYTAEEYASLCARLLRSLRPDIAVDRFVAQAPEGLLVSPKWGMKNYQFTALLERTLADIGFPPLADRLAFAL